MKKDNNKKQSSYKKDRFLIALLLILLIISVGYSYLSSNLSIIGLGGTGKIAWDVHFENVVEDRENNIIAVTPAKVAENSTKISFDVELILPGDKYGFDVDITNDGTIDAMIGSLSIYGVSFEQENYLTFSVTYADGQPLKEKDLLKAGETKTIHLEISYDDNANIDQVIYDEVINLVFDANYIQADETAVER